MDKTDSTQQELFTATTLAAAAGVTFSYVARLCRNGEIPCQKIGGVWLIQYDVGMAWIEERNTKLEAQES